MIGHGKLNLELRNQIILDRGADTGKAECHPSHAFQKGHKKNMNQEST